MLMEVLVEDFQNLKTIAAKLDHPRTAINLLHPVENIIAISIAAMISGAEGSKFIARRADEKKDWLSGPPCQNSNFLNRNWQRCKPRSSAIAPFCSSRPI